MLVTLRGQRVKGILVSMSLGIPLISFGNMPSKHLFPSIVILLSASLTCKVKNLAQVFFSIIFFSFGEEANSIPHKPKIKMCEDVVDIK